MFLGYAIFGLQVLYLKYLAVDYRVKNLSQGCSPADSTGYPQAKLWKINNIFFLFIYYSKNGETQQAIMY